MMACTTVTEPRALALSLLGEIREATRDGLGVTRESYGAGENTALRILTERGSWPAATARFPRGNRRHPWLRGDCASRSRCG